MEILTYIQTSTSINALNHELDNIFCGRNSYIPVRYMELDTAYHCGRYLNIFKHHTERHMTLNSVLDLSTGESARVVGIYAGWVQIEITSGERAGMRLPLNEGDVS